MIPKNWQGGAHLNHPNVHQEWSRWSEDQTLHIAAVYSNPFRWQSRRKHFNDCLRHMRSCPNVALYPVELAYGDRPFEVTEEGDPLAVRLRTDCEMFHKENLINIGVSRFPDGWKWGGYTDGDFHFTRYDWALEAIQMLQHHEFVQLFSNYADLTSATATSQLGHRMYRHNSSFAWNFLNQAAFKQTKQQQQPVKTDPYYGHALPAATKEWPFGFPPGAPGGAWAWRRSAFDTVGGMLDTCVMGSGDWWMAWGLIGKQTMGQGDTHIRNYNEDVANWQRRAKALTANIGCVDNFALHFYHGAASNRAYGSREGILRDNQFDPRFDITRDWQGVYRWTGNKPALRDKMRSYFLSRHEDDPSPHA
jgi:hypothetical protein